MKLSIILTAVLATPIAALPLPLPAGTSTYSVELAHQTSNPTTILERKIDLKAAEAKFVKRGCELGGRTDC